MLDNLTPAELTELFSRLSRWHHALCDIAHALHVASMASWDDARPCALELQARRELYVLASEDLFAVIREAWSLLGADRAPVDYELTGAGERAARDV